MIDRILSSYLRLQTPLMALLPALSTSTFPLQDGIAQVGIWYGHIPQPAPRPCLLILPASSYDVGNTSNGVLINKLETVTICICGEDGKLDPINAIYDVLEKIVCGDTRADPRTVGMRQIWLPASDAANKVWLQSALWQTPYYHSLSSFDGGETNTPHWEIPLRCSYNKP